MTAPTGIPGRVPAPGDVVAVRSSGAASRWIRFGEAMRELVTSTPEPNLDNHIAVVHHVDKQNVLWGIEGRPGGVGWVDMATYMASPYTLTNLHQPKTLGQRTLVCSTVEKMLGTPYDWEGIVADAGDAFGLDKLWAPTWHGGQVPGHVVCSSLAAFAYSRASLSRPVMVGGGREVEPSDWVRFILEHLYA